MQADVVSVDPRTGDPTGWTVIEATPSDVDSAVRSLAALDAVDRPALLREMAASLEASRTEILQAADRETALGPVRLEGEFARTTGQLRFMAEVVEDGAYLGVVIDRGDGTRPDLRRMKVPLGPVAVFAASNFPLAFSVPGGDTASALAAGCPVVVKAHPGHPETSRRCAAALGRVLPGAVTVIHGWQAGLELVRHPLITAVGFTGSVAGGRALHDMAAARPVPIPFYGELGSLNPVVITPAAASRVGSGSSVPSRGWCCCRRGASCWTPWVPRWARSRAARC
jgi:NADP-dependent aldehyde dehydrogenase